MAQKVRVGVNGYGVIGKRVADAVTLQDDMELVGVADVVHDYRIRVALERGYPVFAATPEAREEMATAGVPVVGTLDTLVQQVEAVVDCTPKKIAAANRPLYEQAGVKAIYQGGEKHEVAGYSFVAQANYAGALHGRGLVKRARVVILRRATDPWESHKEGMINTVVPETRVPSHQGPDAQTVIADLPLTTIAAAASHNLSHLHFAMVETARDTSLDEVRDALWDAPRIAFVRAKDNLVALNSVIELMRDLGQPRGDMWEVAVWEDSLALADGESYLTYQVHNEAIVIPETIDAIRALTELEPYGQRSIAKTDAALGITKHFLPSSEPVSIPHLGGPDVLHPAAAAVHAAHIACLCEGFKGAEEPVAWEA